MNKYLKHILSETIFLLPYLLMATSFLFVILPKFGYQLDSNFWRNFGGYSLSTNILFLYVFTFNKKYCFTTRMLPISTTIVSIYNMSASFLPEYYMQYKTMFEILVLSVTLLVGTILCLNKKLNKR